MRSKEEIGKMRKDLDVEMERAYNSMLYDFAPECKDLFDYKGWVWGINDRGRCVERVPSLDEITEHCNKEIDYAQTKLIKEISESDERPFYYSSCGRIALTVAFYDGINGGWVSNWFLDVCDM